MTDIGNEVSHSLFISDLHLCASRPAIIKAFINFLQNTASKAERLYILGDLFEYWAGDDDIDHADHAEIIHALKLLSDSGTKLFFIHGNRDFLINDQFSKAANIKILPDPSEINLYGKRVLISHGDNLCTDDKDYQAFRKQVRMATWQAEFLSHPLNARKSQIESLRLQSEHAKSNKSQEIMDVNNEAVFTMMRQHQYPQIFIHGHTHRPNNHRMTIDDHLCQRIVLGDWYEHGSCIRLDEKGLYNQFITI